MNIKVKAFTTILATVLSGASLAANCPAGVDFVAPQGHDGRAKAVAGLSNMFKAARNKDEAAFMATAADPYIQHSPDLADGMKPVWDLLAKRPAGFSLKQMRWLGVKGFLDNGDYLVMLREVDRGEGEPPTKVFDLMRFDEAGKYAEHWDLRQPLSKETASGRSETEDGERIH